MQNITNGINSNFFASFGIYIIISLVIMLILIVSTWIIFKKAGKNGWEAIIPIYNLWTLFEVGGQKGAYIFLFLIPCVGPIIFLVYEIKAILEVCKRFWKETGFGIFAIFFPFIAFPIIAFSKNNYVITEKEIESSILDVDTNGVSNDKEFNYGYEETSDETDKDEGNNIVDRFHTPSSLDKKE